MIRDYRFTLAAVAGTLCLLALAEINGEALGLAFLHGAPNGVQAALLIAGAALLVWGLGGPRRARSALNRDLWPLVIVTLVAFALRVVRLEDAVHFYVDEGNFVEGVLKLQAEPHIKLLGPFNWIAAFTWAYPYMQYVSVSIFGPSLLALRLVSAALGTLTIPAVYLLGRALFDRRAALLAALLLAVFPPHVHFSRLGLNNIADPLLGTLALAFLTRGLKGGTRRDFALAGVFLGLTQYFYEGGRLLFPVLALAWAGIGLMAWRTRARRLLLTALAALIVAAPVYVTLAAWQMPLASRLSRQALPAEYWPSLLLSGGDSGLVTAYMREQLVPPLLHIISLPDESAFYYGGDSALVLPFMLPLLALGAAAALRRPAAGALLLLWIALAALGNSLLKDNVWTARYVVIFPPLALLLGVGLAAALKLLARIPARRRREAAPALLVALICAAQVAYYFGPHLARYNQQIRPEHDQQDVMFRARSFPPGTQIYIVTDDQIVWPPVLIFLSRFWGIDREADLHILTPDEFAALPPLAGLWQGTDHAFFIQTEDEAARARLHFELGLVAGQPSPYNVPLEKQFLLYYYAPPRQVA
jgi:hypothetical protein